MLALLLAVLMVACVFVAVVGAIAWSTIQYRDAKKWRLLVKAVEARPKAEGDWKITYLLKKKTDTAYVNAKTEGDALMQFSRHNTYDRIDKIERNQ